MKKIFFAICALATLTFASCEKEPIGGTAVEAMSGQWYVQISGVDENGVFLYGDADLYELGSFILLTYNTATNGGDSLWISSPVNFKDYGYDFLNYKVKVECNQSERVFERKRDDVAIFGGNYERNFKETWITAFFSGSDFIYDRMSFTRNPC